MLTFYEGSRMGIAEGFRIRLEGFLNWYLLFCSWFVPMISNDVQIQETSPLMLSTLL